VEFYPDEIHAPGDALAPSESEHSDSEGSQWLRELRNARRSEGKSPTKVKIGPELAALGYYTRSMKPTGHDFLTSRTQFVKA